MADCLPARLLGRLSGAAGLPWAAVLLFVRGEKGGQRHTSSSHSSSPVTASLIPTADGSPMIPLCKEWRVMLFHHTDNNMHGLGCRDDSAGMQECQFVFSKLKMSHHSQLINQEQDMLELNWTRLWFNCFIQFQRIFFLYLIIFLSFGLLMRKVFLNSYRKTVCNLQFEDIINSIACTSRPTFFFSVLRTEMASVVAQQKMINNPKQIKKHNPIIFSKWQIIRLLKYAKITQRLSSNY